MKIGHARIDLTPKEGEEFYLLGYKTPLRNEPAKGIHDHIFSNALLFQKEDDSFFLWSADLLELPEETCEDIKTCLEKRFGINRDHIILAVMHNHSSIRDFHRNWEFGKYNPEYDEFLMQSVEDSYNQCLDNLQNATAKTGEEIIIGYYSNRNHKGLPADNNVTVVKFYDEQNKPFAAIVNWAVHSTGLGAENMYLTGDMAGNTCRKLQEIWGYYPLMLNGAAGDCSNRYNRQGKGFDELDRVTTGLADEISKIRCDKSIRIDNIKQISLSHEIVTDMDAYHKVLEEYLDKIKNGQLETLDHMPQSHLIEKIQGELQRQKFELNIRFGVVDVGDLRFYVFPGELGSKFGIQLREETKGKTVLVAGYANGFNYYFLNKEEYGLSFETIGNPVPPGEPECIVKKMLEAGAFLS